MYELLPLLNQLGYPVTEQDLKRRLTTFLAQRGQGIAIACHEKGSIVGLIAWSKSHLLLKDKVRYHIEALVVDTHYRKQGIGQKLMQYLESLALQGEPAIIDLTSGVRRAPEGTHDFYKRLGYHNEGAMAKIYLRKEIS
nr:GNAT family N-acetyltransferase [Candidatus Odyssella thessalonicensis]